MHILTHNPVSSDFCIIPDSVSSQKPNMAAQSSIIPLAPFAHPTCTTRPHNEAFTALLLLAVLGSWWLAYLTRAAASHFLKSNVTKDSAAKNRRLRRHIARSEDDEWRANPRRSRTIGLDLVHVDDMEEYMERTRRMYEREFGVEDADGSGEEL